MGSSITGKDLASFQGLPPFSPSDVSLSYHGFCSTTGMGYHVCWQNALSLNLPTMFKTVPMTSRSLHCMTLRMISLAAELILPRQLVSGCYYKFSLAQFGVFAAVGQVLETIESQIGNFINF